MDDASLQFDFEVSPETLAKLQSTIADAVSAGFKRGFAGQDWGAAMKAQFDAVSRGAREYVAESKNATKANKVQEESLSRLEEQAARYIRVLALQGDAVGAIVAASNRVRTNERQASITERTFQDRQLQERLALIDRETKSIAQSARTQGELQVNAAKVAGKQRVQITRAVLETIARLEKATFAGLAGAAKTATSAVSRSFSALGSALRRNTNDINDGLPRALRGREADMRSSFGRQEAIVRQSTLRQQASLRSLNTQVSTGVLGGLTGRGVGLGIGAAFGGVSIVNAFKDGYAEAVNFNEQVNKNKVVFGEFASVVFDFTKNAPSELGATKGAALEATGVFGNLFRAVQIGEETAAGMSVGLTQIATDLSSFNNAEIDEVFTALRSGLVGEAEPLRRFGIDVSDARLRIEALNLGIYNGVGTLTASQKAQAAYSAILKDSALAAGDFERTQDEGANAARRRQAAFKEFAASIVNLAKPAIDAFNVSMIGVLSTFTAFAQGGEELSDGLQILRSALKGAAAGLGAVIAVKAGVEVFQLLAKTLPLLLSPLGLVLATASLLGAALAVLLERSAPLRRTFTELANRLVEVGDRIRSALEPALEALRGALDNYVIPAIDRAAQFLADNLLPAIDAVSGFITGTALPALRDFAEVVERGLGVALGFIADQATRFFNAVRPFLQPAIDGFRDLGDAIGGAFGGDFSGLQSGAASAVSGIGATVANIAGAVGVALLPVGRSVLNFFLELFSGPNLKKYASAFLGFVEEAGRIIGSIVSSPIFLKAVAAVAAAAVIVAARFVEGFARGVIANLPEVAGLIGGALLAGLKAALSNPLVIVGAIAFASLASRLFQLFRGAGTQAGAGFTAGLKSSLVGARGGAAALFGGTSGAITSSAKAANAAFRKEQQALINQTRILGGDTRLVSPRTIDEAKKQIARLSEGLSQSQLNALRWRDTFQQATTGVRGVFSGLISASKAIGPALAAPIRGYVAALKATDVYTGPGTGGGKAFAGAFTASLRTAGSTFVGGMRTALSALEQYSISQGQSIGRSIGQALSKGAQVGLAAVGGFVAGKAEGERGGSGAFSALTAGLTGLAVGGPVVGAVAAGASLIGTAFGKAGIQAKKMKEAVAQLTNSLKQDLVAAVESGALSLAKLQAGALSFSDVSGFAGILETFKTELGDDGVALFDDLGLSFQQNILPIIKSGGDLDILQDKLRTSFINAATSSDEFASRFGDDAATVRELLKGLSSDAKFIDLRLAAEQAGGSGAAPLVELLGRQEGFINDIFNTAGDIERSAKATKIALDAINSAAATGFAFTDIDVGEATAPIDTIENRLGQFDAIITAIDIKWKNFLTPGDDSNLTEVIDNAIVQADALGSQRDVREGESLLVYNARASGIDREIASLVADGVKAGFESGEAVDAATALAVVQPIIDAYVAGVPKEQQDLLRTFLEGAVPQLAIDFDNVGTASNGKKALEATQAAVDELIANAPTSLNITVPKAEALVDAGLTVDAVQAFIKNNPKLNAEGIKIGEFTFDEAAAKLVAISAAASFSEDFGAASRGEMEDQGGDLVDGLIRGIEGQTAAARRAAAVLAAAVLEESRLRFGIKSPSKVFREMGQFITEGLVLGIDDGAADVSTAITNAIDKALVAARAGGSKVAAAMAEAGAGLFAALTGSQSPLNLGSMLTGAQSGVTTALQSFLSTFDSNLSTVFSVGGKKSSELTAADKNILGESLFSLNVEDVIGASNLQALTGAFDAIAELGQTMLGQGQEAGAVTAELQKQVDALVVAAVGLGFSEAQVRELADTLGLSNEALADFVQQLNDITISEAAGPQTSLPSVIAPPPSQTGPSSPTRRAEGAIVNNIYLPSGDPEANALAVANRQASLLFR